MPYPGTVTPYADTATVYPSPLLPPAGLTVRYPGAAGAQTSLALTGAALTASGDQAQHLSEAAFRARDNTIQPVASLTANFPAAALATGPSVYEPMDSMFAADDKVAGTQPVAVGAFVGGLPTLGSSTSGGPFTTLDKGYTALGTNQWVADFASSPFVNGTTRTFFGWCKLATGATLQIPLGSNGVSFLAVQVQPSTGINLYTNATLGATWAGARFNDSAWHFWALVLRDATDAALLYYDGALVSQQSWAGGYGATPGVLMWSNYVGGGQGVVGSIAHCGWATSELSAGQIAGMYAAR